MLAIALVSLWAAYTWIPQVRAAIDDTLAPVGAGIANALSGTYTTIVTSQFWQTWITPSLHSFAIGMAVMTLVVIVAYKVKPRIHRPAIIARQTQPEYTAPQVIPETAKHPIPEPASEKEVEA